MSNGRYIQTSHFNGFFVFFQYLCEYVIHWNKRHIFLCLFVFLLTITGRNEAIIVELKVFCFEWHFYHLFRGFPSLDFSQLWKMVPALAFNPVFVATSAWWGKWNRHAVAPSDNFFTHTCSFFNFCKKMQKMKIDYVHCPMRKLWRTSLRPFRQNNVGISKNWDTWERLH